LGVPLVLYKVYYQLSLVYFYCKNKVRP